MRSFIPLTLLLFLFVYELSHSQVTSDFETDIEDWFSEGDGDYEWELGTGNPGNNFRVNDDATGNINLAYAPPKFLGDWSNATTSDYLSADIFLHQINGGYSNSNFVFQIEGPGGKAKALAGTNPAFDVWITYSVNLDPAQWDILEGTWSGILSQVNELIVRMEYINGDEWNRLDNVELSFTPIVIPIAPVICSDFEEGGFDGWSFQNGGSISNQSSGGNPGRYIRITDGSGVTLANCPPKFLGDWTQLDNHAAEIQTDIIVSGFSGTTFLHDFFIKLQGPGGEAIFPIDNSIENAFNQWYTFAFPVDETFWTMNTGTWNTLISNVNKVTLVVEYINGSETVGLDNFCITNLPPVANFEASPVITFPGNPVQFNDLSSRAPTSWNWQFGDGQSDNERNPLHSYSNSGAYTVELTASNYFGSDDEIKTSFVEVLDDSQCVKYDDDFEDASIFQVWDIINGSWSESGGILRQTSNYYVSGDYLDGCYALVGSFSWENYIVTCDMKSTDNDWMGFVFNYQDDQNMYMFHWNAQVGSRRLVKWVDGVENILAQDDVGYTQNIWYNFEIQSLAGQIKVIINGETIFTAADNTFLQGKTGLYCWANQQTHYDNFKVSCEGILVDLQAFLEGPFAGTVMSTDLNTLDLLPLSQPYAGSPWNYNGFEEISSIPNSNIVDWVLVELRDATSAALALPGTIIGQRAGFILNDGSIVGTDGTNPCRFTVDYQNQLFAVVHHRNHLSVMSSAPLQNIAGAFKFDFTTGATQAYGTEALKNLGNGNYGLYSGDLNSDGMINIDDLNSLWDVQAGYSGYNQPDGNLDGQVNNKDKNDTWYLNDGLETQLPE